MNTLTRGWKWLSVLAVCLAMSVSAHALTFYFNVNTGLASDYIQYGPTDSIIVNDGPTGIAYVLSWDGGPPYQLHVSVNTNNPAGSYYIGTINNIEPVYVVLY